MSAKKFACAALAAILAIACFAGCTPKNDNTFKIGATGPLTGDAASYGVSVQKGATIAIEEINAAGGLNGYLFSFDMKDDMAEVAPASQAYDTLFEDGMQVSLGSITSGSCKAFAAKAVEDGLFFLTPSASEEAVLDFAPSAHRVCFGDADQGTMAADKIKADGYKNIGAIYDTSDSYSSGIFDAFDKEMKKLGLTYKTQTFDKESNKDFSTQVEALKDCDIIFMPFYYTEASLIAKVCQSKGCTADLFGCDGFDSIETKLTASDNIKNKIFYITPFDANSTNEVSAKFTAAYKAKYNETPNQFAADGYDSVMAIYAAMKKANVDDVNISAADLGVILNQIFVSADFTYTGATGEMKWDATGACTKTPVIVTLDLSK